MIHTQIAPSEQADRLAIRELVDAYAHCADFNGQSTVALEGDRATGESYWHRPPPIHPRRRAKAKW